jgi:hypothetical protein
LTIALTRLTSYPEIISSICQEKAHDDFAMKSSWAFCSSLGNVLLSRNPAVQVPSALEGLTVVFEMGTRGSLPPLSPNGMFRSHASKHQLHNVPRGTGSLNQVCSLKTSSETKRCNKLMCVASSLFWGSPQSNRYTLRSFTSLCGVKALQGKALFVSVTIG